MGASQSGYIKNTFIDIDTSPFDGTEKDRRKILSFPGRYPSSIANDGPEENADGNNSGTDVLGGDNSQQEREHADDCTAGRQRLNTFDPLEYQEWTAQAYIAEPTESPAEMYSFSSVAQVDPPSQSPQEWTAQADVWEPTEYSAGTDTSNFSSFEQFEPPAPAVEKNASFWNSWNISGNARRSLKERVAASDPVTVQYDTRPVDFIQGGESSGYVPASGQYPTLICSRTNAEYDTVNGNRVSSSMLSNQTSSRDTEAQAQAHGTPGHSWTCRMIRNLPNDYVRNDVIELLESYGLSFDFVYLPIDWKKKSNLGYAFVNFTSPGEAEGSAALLNGHSAWKVTSEKVCEVVWGKEDQQGLQTNIKRFRNSPVMHADVPEEFKPALFASGCRIPFPAPTERIKRDRHLTAASVQHSSA